MLQEFQKEGKGLFMADDSIPHVQSSLVQSSSGASVVQGSNNEPCARRLHTFSERYPGVWDHLAEMGSDLEEGLSRPGD